MNELLQVEIELGQGVGGLGELTARLNHLNISGGCALERGPLASAMLVFDPADEEEVHVALEGYQFHSRPVLGMSVANVPGQLAGATETLRNAGVNILTWSLAFVGDQVNFVFDVGDDYAAALAAFA